MTEDRPHPDTSRWAGAHPDFDGHLEYPIEKMSDAERLRWAWEGTMLLHWAKRSGISRQQRETRADGDNQ